MRKVIFMTCLMLSSCINQGNETYARLEPDDLPVQVSFPQHVFPLFEKSCLSCHTTGAKYGFSEPDLSSYDAIVFGSSSAEESKGGWNSVKQQAIDGAAMPPWSRDRWSARDKAILIKWEEQGFPK